MIEIDQELIQEFTVEADEHLQLFENSLLRLEKAPHDAEALNEAFRSIHSIKGLANYMGLARLSELTHQMENILAKARGGHLTIDSPMIEIQLIAKDLLQKLIAELVDHQEERSDTSAILAQLNAISADEQPHLPITPAVEPAASEKIAADTTETRVEETLHIPDDVPIFDQLEQFDLSDEMDADWSKISGVGQAKAKALRAAGFRTVGDVRAAHKADLMAVKGINAHLAELILSEFQPFIAPVEVAATAVAPDELRPIPPAPAEPEPADDEEPDLVELFLKTAKSRLDDMGAMIQALKKDIEQPDVTKKLIRELTNLQSSAGYLGMEQVIEMLAPMIALAGQIGPDNLYQLESDFFNLRNLLHLVENPTPVVANDDEISAVEPDLADSGLPPLDSNEDILEIFLTNALKRLDELSDYLKKAAIAPGQTDLAPKIKRHLQELLVSATYMGFQDLAQVLKRMMTIPDQMTIDHVNSLVADYQLAVAHLNELSESLAHAAESDEMAGGRREESQPLAHESTRVAEALGPKTRAPKRTIRVDTEKIDNLIASVGEMVVNRSSFGQISHDFREIIRQLAENPAIQKRELRFLKETRMRFEQTILELSRIANDLQEGVMQVRMVTVSDLFNRFPRLVRQLANEMGKEVQLVISGGDTELDKNVIEEIYDPLMHLLRNAVDHGIEFPEERQQTGKPAGGTIHLSARHDGDKVIIKIRDDGRGINPNRIRETAVKRGIFSANEAQNLTDKETLNLIFHPGFSTAEKVSNISGRGVGMDVVKKNVDELKGTIEINTESGEFTEFRIILPLTLAIIQALLVKIKNEIYCIPLTSVLETERTWENKIETIENHEVIRLRDKVLPLLRLADIFRVEETPLSSAGDRLFVVIVTDGLREVGLMVNSLIGEESIVIKPLEDAYMETRGVSGATIMGDGRVSLILDIPALIEYVLEQTRTQRQIAKNNGHHTG